VTDIDQTVEAFAKLPTAVVADVFRHSTYFQQVMNASIQPLHDGWKLCGRAFTHSNLPRRKNEPNVFNEAEKAMRPGDVIVESYLGAWGINFAVGAHARGCAGVVVDGPHRDLAAHKQLLPDFPLFCRRGLDERSANPGGSHRSFRTRWLHAFNVPINCGGVRVEPGDIILGDDDGVVVVPREIEQDVLRFATALEQAEHECLQAKQAMKSDSEAHEPIDRWVKDTGIQQWGRERQR
jgi:4-hydroxy-4-methyl-2-oxoglutarate aldolase